MAETRLTRIARDERGTALIEAAIIVPVVLLIMVGIFEVGRAYQTYQVLTNAAREGARTAILPGATDGKVRDVVQSYIRSGYIAPGEGAEPVRIDVDRESTITLTSGDTVGASLVTIDYPFKFIVLQPVVHLVNSGSDLGDALTLRVTSVMRNESF